MMVYRIRDWKRIFENNRTRELKRMEWVPIPNKHDSDGFTALMEKPDAAALYGTWILLVQVASKCEPRGTLIRQPAGLPHSPAGLPHSPAGLPHSPATLSRIIRCPAELIQRAFEACIDVGWIEMVETQNLSKGATIPQEGAGLGSEQNTTSPQEGATIPQEGATIPQEGAAGTRAYRARQDGTEQKRTEGNGIGRNGTESAGAGATTGIFAPSARFTDWWQLWSGTKGTSSRVKAEAAYRQHVPAVAELDCFECTAS